MSSGNGRQEKGWKLKVAEPCHMKWAELKGAGPKRWCDQCSLHVVDGASLTRTEAKELVQFAEDRVCMRITEDAAGTPIHRSPEPDGGTLAAKLLRIGLTAAAGVMAACGDRPLDPGPPAGETPESSPPVTPLEVTDPPAERPLEIMGDVCYVEEHEVQQPEAPEEAAPDEVAEPKTRVQIMGDRMGRMVVEHIPVDDLSSAPGPDRR